MRKKLKVLVPSLEEYEQKIVRFNPAKLVASHAEAEQMAKASKE